MSEPSTEVRARPMPRRVVDGVLSATFHRPHWLLWHVEPCDERDELVAALVARGVDVVEASYAEPSPALLPRDVVVVCPAGEVATLAPELEAAQLVSFGSGHPPRRGDVHVNDLGHLVTLLAATSDVATTSTYHEV